MRHLFASRCEVLRMSAVMKNGVPNMSWNKVTAMVDPWLGVSGELMCRLDLNFLRPGKDQPAPIVAGRAMDRIGVMYFSPTTALRANDRVRAIAGPVAGVFEVRNTPDPAVDYRSAHHFEVQVIEVAQSVDVGVNAGTPIIEEGP